LKVENNDHLKYNRSKFLQQYFAVFAEKISETKMVKGKSSEFENVSIV